MLPVPGIDSREYHEESMGQNMPQGQNSSMEDIHQHVKKLKTLLDFDFTQSKDMGRDGMSASRRRPR
jgi:hypothetical protein